MRRQLSIVLLFLLVAASSSCSGRTRSVAPEPAPAAPAADSPAGAVRALEWAWNNRSCETLAGLFPDDYVFAFAFGDSAGNTYRNDPWTRDDELAASCNLFADAAEIDLTFDRTLIPLSDDRPGKDPHWHRSIRTSATLTVNLENQGLNEIQGYAKFYLVRGDSAVIPPELVARGFQPDSTRWWIDRWEDQTLPAGMRANPANNRTWGALKALFR